MGRRPYVRPRGSSIPSRFLLFQIPRPDRGSLRELLPRTLGSLLTDATPRSLRPPPTLLFARRYAGVTWSRWTAGLRQTWYP